MQFLKLRLMQKYIHNKYNMDILDKDGIYPLHSFEPHFSICKMRVIPPCKGFQTTVIIAIFC